MIKGGLAASQFQLIAEKLIHSIIWCFFMSKNKTNASFFHTCALVFGL